MKFTLSWLKDHLDTNASLDKISETLTDIGLEVEEIVDPAEKLAPFKVAKIVEAEQHPNADRLRVCKVDAGGDVIQVVCGAPNARAGLVGIFAPSGTYVPGTDLLLKPTKIRGVESSGMMCSARELELGDDHDGIIELDGEHAIGSPAANALGATDPMIEIAITPNRADCLGVYGIARDLAAAGLGTLKEPGLRQGVEDILGEGACPIGINLQFEPGTEDVCPAFAGRLVRGVKNGSSPQWMQDRLKAIGLRPISALVDITNYVMFDRGRPLHVYDASKLTGNIGARLSRNGETLEALDDKTYELDGEVCVIVDESGPVGLGGVMGGVSTGCSDETVDVFIESAAFEPVRTARTGRVLNINSDARYRFERGVDPGFMVAGLDLATKLVMDLCGGTPTEKVVAGEPKLQRAEFALEPSRVKQLTGVDVSRERAVSILGSLGFDPDADGGNAGGPISTKAPTWRPDIHGSADLVEEVIRIEGLSAVPSTPMSRPPISTPSPLTLNQSRVRRARRAAAAAGLIETVNWSFIPGPHAELFGAPQGGGVLRLANPISQDMSTMRPALLPGLLAALRRNQVRGESDICLFEIGQVFAGDQPDEQSAVASGVRSGAPLRHWQDNASAYDAFDAKADALAIIEALDGPPVPQITRDAPAWYHPGRSGTLRLGPKVVLAHFGELHPSVQTSFDIDTPIVAFEVFLDALPKPKNKSGRARPALSVSELMPVVRDFAFLVDAAVEVGDMVRAAQSADKSLIDRVGVFDVYQGKGVEDGKKSVAIEVRLQPVEKTLTDAEIDAVGQRIIEAITKKTGGTLR